MSRREDLAREAARLFAEKGYHGTSIGALADAIGVQKASLYAHIAGKQDLLFETMRHGAELAAAAAPDFERIYVFGGDGAFNEVVNGIEGADVALGFLPGGGTSVLPRALGLPRDPVEAARRLGRSGRERRITVGRVNGRRFTF